MMELFRIYEEHNLFSVLIPPFFEEADWTRIVSPRGFIWIQGQRIGPPANIEAHVAQTVFDDDVAGLRCSISLMEYDISIPATEFLRLVHSAFPGGIDFVHSEKHQPPGLRLSSIPERSQRWVMEQNQIDLVFHRPWQGERSIITSASRELVETIVDRFRD